jgi:hypothetical protein
MSALEVPIDDEKRQQEGLASDANTMVEKPASDIMKSDIEGEKTDIEAERTDVEGDNGSRNAPSAEVLPEDTLAPDDYPKGIQFIFILLALILSIFMVALDLVCSSSIPQFRFISADLIV